MATKAKAKKAPVKAAAAEPTTVTTTDAVKRGPKVRKGGQRGRIYGAVPAKGSIHIKELVAQANELKVPAKDIPALVAKLVAGKYLDQC